MNKFLATYRSWRAYRLTCDELLRLSPRELQDLGMTRADIPRIAKGHFAR